MKEMNDQLKELAEKYKRDLTLRDGGEKAKATYLEVKAIATPKQLIAILEEVHKLL